MVRTNDDTWDVTENVGHTAVQVAMGRMAESASDAPLFTDPYAELFVQAALDSGWTSPFTEEVLAEMIAADPMALNRMMSMKDYTAVRTRYFDDFFMEGSRHGINQAVIVAAGLDARAWRLQWRPDTTVFELDQPNVLAFKKRVMSSNDAQPAARYVAVGTDLRYEWQGALRQAGFDDSRPAMWIVEGLLPYITATDQDVLFERIDSLSAPGSRIAIEAFDDRFYDASGSGQGAGELFGRAAVTVNGQASSTGQLFFLEQRVDVAERLGERGWVTGAVEAVGMMERYGRTLQAELRDTFIKAIFVEATR